MSTESDLARQALSRFSLDLDARPKYRYLLGATGQAASLRDIPASAAVVARAGRHRAMWTVLRAGWRNLTIRRKKHLLVASPRIANDSFSGPWIAKLALEHPRRPRGLDGEFEGRRQFSAMVSEDSDPSLRIPAMLASGRGREWFVQPFISRTPSMNVVDVARRFFDLGPATMYLGAAPRLAPIGEYISHRRLDPDEISRILRARGHHRESTLLEAAWPVVAGHGDLTADNVVPDRNGSLWIIDWELFGPIPIAYELVKMAKWCEREACEVIAAVTHAADGEVSARAQLRIAEAIRSAFVQHRPMASKTQYGAV